MSEPVSYREQLLRAIEAVHKQVCSWRRPSAATLRSYCSLIKSLEDLDHGAELGKAAALEASLKVLEDRIKHLEAALSVRRATVGPQPRIA